MSILGGLIASGTSMKSRPMASCHINLTKLDIMWCLNQDFSVFKCLRFRVSHILTKKLSIYSPTRGDVFSVQFFFHLVLCFSAYIPSSLMWVTQNWWIWALKLHSLPVMKGDCLPSMPVEENQHARQTQLPGEHFSSSTRGAWVRFITFGKQGPAFIFLKRLIIIAL